MELKVGYLITFVGSWAESKGYTGKFFRLLLKEHLIYITGEGDKTEFTAVATGAKSGFINIEALEPSTNQLYIIRPGVRDGCKYHAKLTGKDRHGPALDIDMAYFTNQDSFYTDPSEALEFFLVNDMFPSYNAVNDTGATITPKIYFKGTQWDFKEVPKAEPYSIVTLGGLK